MVIGASVLRSGTPRAVNDDNQLSSRFASPRKAPHSLLLQHINYPQVAKMGSIEAPKERILIVFMRDLPPALIEEIKGKFPGYDLKIHRSDPGNPVAKG